MYIQVMYTECMEDNSTTKEQEENQKNLLKAQAEDFKSYERALNIVSGTEEVASFSDEDSEYMRRRLQQLGHFDIALDIEDRMKAGAK